MRDRFDAIVIGAGPAGSSTAILLARAGWSVALVEKQRFPRRKVCGECIAASNLPLLQALGIGAAFEAAAGPELRRMALMAGDDQALAALPAAAQPGSAWGRALGRETLDTLLIEQAGRAGAEVFQPWTVEGVEGSSGRWQCRVRAIDDLHRPAFDGMSTPTPNSPALRVLSAPVLIAANGSWELLPSERTRCRLERRRSSGLLAFKANFRGSALAPGVLPVIAFKGGYGGMVLADDGVMTLACCIRADRLAAVRRDASGLSAGEAVELHLRRACRGVRDALAGAEREGAWLAAGPLAPGVRLGVPDGVFRVGNAAGEAHPIVGEGMSMALQGAWLLCEALFCEALLHAVPGPTTVVNRADAADPAWQHRAALRYERQWRSRFGLRMTLAALFAHAAMRPTAAAAAVAVARGWPTLLTLGARCCGKTQSAADPSRLADLLASHAAAGRKVMALASAQAPSLAVNEEPM